MNGDENGAGAPDPVQIYEHAQAMHRRAGETVCIGLVVYSCVCVWMAVMNWGMTWGEGSPPFRIGVTMSFGDAAAILGVLGGLVVAINIIVWGWHTTGRSDPRVYAHAQTMARASVAIGQAAVFVGVALMLSFAAVEVDIPRLASGLIAVAVIVLIAVHTAEGLNDGTNLERQVYRAGVSADAARLGRVVRRWHVVGASENRLMRRAVRDVTIFAMWVSAPAIVGLYVVGENGRQFEASIMNCGIVFVSSLILAIVTFAIIVISVRSFVVRDFFTLAVYAAVAILASVSYLLSALTLALRQENVPWPLIFGLALWMLVGTIVFVTVSLLRTRSRWFLGNSARFVVQRSLRKQRTRKLRILRTPAVGAPPRREGRWQRIVDWSNAATGSLEPHASGSAE